MAKLEDNMTLDGDWGGIKELPDGTRIGFTQNFVMFEVEGPDNEVGVYNLPHVPSDRMADFLVWLANLK